MPTTRRATAVDATEPARPAGSLVNSTGSGPVGPPTSSTPHSACVGFGLERWAQWIHSHLGGDPTAWPDHLRTAAD
ncbi:hypothetical protein ACFQ1I_40885 [Kitasatospora arboriphila]